MSEEKVIKLGKRSSKKSETANTEKETEQKTPELTYCSFCGRPNTQVLKMVKGPNVNICSDCVMIAVQYLIMNDRNLSAEAQRLLDAMWRGNK